MPWASRGERRGKAVKHLLANAESAADSEETDADKEMADKVAGDENRTSIARAESEKDEPAADPAPRERYGAPEASEGPPKPAKTDVDASVERAMMERPGSGADDEPMFNEASRASTETKADAAKSAPRAESNAGSDTTDAKWLDALKKKYPRAFALWEAASGVAKAGSAPGRALIGAQAAGASMVGKGAETVAREGAAMGREIVGLTQEAAPQTARDKVHAFTAFLRDLGAKDIPEPTTASIVGD